MRQPPDWWADLIAETTARQLGIRWNNPDEFKPVDDEAWTGTMSNEHLDALDAQQRAGKVVVGTGPQVTNRGTGTTATVQWYLDPAAPQRLWCALAEFYPAWLWIDVEPRADELAAVLSASHPKPRLDRRTLTAFSRGFLGFRPEVGIPNIHSGEMVPFNGADLDGYFGGVRYVEPGGWGSSRLDDPLPDDLPVGDPDDLAAAAGVDSHAQLLGRVPSMTWRTLHSRSHLSFEVHMRGLVYAAVRYRPSPPTHRAVLRRFNENYRSCFPLDMPLDVVGALAGFQFATEETLEPFLTEPRDTIELATGLRVFAGLWCGDLRRVHRLREFADHTDPGVRLELARAANWYGYRFLLEEIALAETDPEMVANLEGLIIEGSRPDTFNAFGDHFDERPIMIDRNGAPVDTWDDADDTDEDSERAK